MVPACSDRTSRQHHRSRYPPGPTRFPSGAPSPRQHSGQPDHRCARAESRSRDHDLADQGRALATPGARRILVLTANRGRGLHARPGTHSRAGTPPGARPWTHQGHGRPRRRPGLPARSCGRTRQPPGGRPVCLEEIAATVECGGNSVGSAIRGRRPAALVLARTVSGPYLAAGSPPAASITAAGATATVIAIPAAGQARTRPPRPVGSVAARPRAHRVAREHAAPARRTSIHRARSRFR